MYRLAFFNDVELPDASSEFSNPAGPVADSYVGTLAGGGLDTLGTARAPLQLPFEITLQATAHASSVSELRWKLDIWRGLVGKTAPLVRRSLDNNTEHQVTARLLRIEELHRPIHYHGVFQPLEFQFTALTGWESTYLWDLFYALETLGPSGEKAVEFDVDDSNRNQTSVVLELTSGSAAISLARLSVPLAKADWYWVGELAAGSTLRIDCGAMTVLQNGIDDYKSFFLTDNHKSTHWLELIPQPLQSWTEAPPVMPPAITGNFYYTDDGTAGTDGILKVSFRRAYM